MFSKTATMKSINGYWDNEKPERFLEEVKIKINDADAVVIGAGAGLSASAGFSYSGKRFENNFPDFIEKYVYCRLLPLQNIGRTLGVLEPLYHHQPLSKCTETSLPEFIQSGKG